MIGRTGAFFEQNQDNGLGLLNAQDVILDRFARRRTLGGRYLHSVTQGNPERLAELKRV